MIGKGQVAQLCPPREETHKLRTASGFVVIVARPASNGFISLLVQGAWDGETTALPTFLRELAAALEADAC